jgi:hypothetical protein
MKKIYLLTFRKNKIQEKKQDLLRVVKKKNNNNNKNNNNRNSFKKGIRLKIRTWCMPHTLKMLSKPI